jgi:cytochrome c oxidase cbb3-type subunit 3
MSSWLHRYSLAIWLAALAFASDAADRHETGRSIYNFRCYFCHGYSGDARTLAATYLVPPPRDFTLSTPDALTREAMLRAVTEGRAGTAMKGFAGILRPEEIAEVVDFVREEFMRRKAQNTRYHTADNGWADHDRHRAAFPFAVGEIALDTPFERLTPHQQRGKRLFLSTCISCHDRARTQDDSPAWDARPLSYPRNLYVPGDSAKAVDAVTGASPYLKHEIPPKLANATPLERKGEALFQKNCAFCHGADGTGKNWIGQFMEPHPRDLTDPTFMRTMNREQLAQRIRDGLPNTSMPAWGKVLKPQDIEAIVAYVGRTFHPISR